MQYIFPLIIFLVCSTVDVVAQTLPAERSTDWSLAGYKGSRNVDYTVVNFVDEGGVPDGLTVNDGIFQSILADLGGSPAVIYFPPGTYFFTSTLNLSSRLVLRGAGADQTTLDFDLGGSGDLIRASGTSSGSSAAFAGTAETGQTSLELADASFLQAGDFIKLVEEDDTLVTSDWALGTSGQVIRVASVDGNTVQLESPLRRSYLPGNSPYALKLLPRTSIGIEQLTIIRRDATDGQTSNIEFNIVADSWIDCVASYNSNFGHIDLRTCTNVDVTGCYMQDGFAYGGGGQGYGVVLHSTTGECLVENNRFKHLRHSMLLQSGANGNVVAYNYSTNPYWTDVGPLPANSAGDLVLHGNWAYFNLFEGNEVAHLVIDNSHGRNGPFNTLFRNRAHLYGIFMNSAPASNMQNFIGNEVSNLNPIMGYYVLAGTGHFQHGNNIRGQITPGGSGGLPETSLYLDAPPSYYTDNGNWPPIGPPNTLGQHSIEAKVLFIDGFETSCEAGITTAVRDELLNNGLSVYPNPAADWVFVAAIAGGSGISALELFSADGRLLRRSDYTDRVSVIGLPAGIYVLRAIDRNGEAVVWKVVLVR